MNKALRLSVLNGLFLTNPAPIKSADKTNINMDNNEWGIQGCYELADYFRTLPKSETYPWSGNSCKNLYTRDLDNKWHTTNQNGIKIITLKEYLDMQKQDNWYIRGCKDLGDYFADKKVFNLCGDEESCAYFKNDDGVWDYVSDPHNNMSIHRKEITLKQYLEWNEEFAVGVQNQIDNLKSRLT